jgi:hypothetical protein
MQHSIDVLSEQDVELISYRVNVLFSLGWRMSWTRVEFPEKYKHCTPSFDYCGNNRFWKKEGATHIIKAYYCEDFDIETNVFTMYDALAYEKIDI